MAVSVCCRVQSIPRAERASAARAQLELVGLSGYERSWPRELSGGMKQRVGIARALVSDPEILLMDEPFSALDEFTRERLHEDILRIWQATGKTVIFVTHNIQEAVFLSDRVCVMSSGPARIVDVREILLPRPRKTMTLQSEEFFHQCSEIRNALEDSHYNIP